MSILQCFGYMIMPLFHVFSWSNHASRREFWLFQVTFGMLMWLLLPHLMAGSWIALSLVLYCCLSEISLTIRRLHHTGRTGWWMVLPVLAVVDFMVREDMLVCGAVWVGFSLFILLKRGLSACDGGGMFSCGDVDIGEKIKDVIGALSVAVGGSAFGVLFFSGFIIHAYTVYIAAKTSGFVATIITLVLPILSEIYWFVRLFVTEGFMNGYTIMLLVFIGCLLSIPLCIGIIGSLGKD